MSISAVMYPIVAAIKGVEKILGPNLAWRAANDTQQRFLAEQYDQCVSEVEQLEFIETLASLEADEINSFLAERGFSIKLEPFKEHEFGVASVLDIGVEWKIKGIKSPIEYLKKEYPGVVMDEGYGVRLHPNHPNPIARIETKSSDLVNLTILDKAPEGLELAALAESLEKDATDVYNGYECLRFPMVDMNHQTDISWLLEMKTSALGEDWAISQALQQTKLRINEKGARAQSAVAVGVIMITSVRQPKPDLLIDKPFLCWFTRPGVRKPTFVAYVTPEDWKEPADLETA